eukprot:GHUV01019813.1.p1 GENE.GHUV01019813.1~~GHUV01019813.1.p1  ORF type:complete len:717 (+),score=259.77 GHUV01019813.1:106-2256(+)
MTAAEKARQLAEQVNHYLNEQQNILSQLQDGLHNATQGRQQTSTAAEVLPVDQQIRALNLLTNTRDYVGRLQAAAAHVKQLERQIRPASQYTEQESEQLVSLAFQAADGYTACQAELSALVSSSFPAEAVPEQLRSSLEQRLQQQLQAAEDLLHQSLSRQIHHCLKQCGWPPPVVSAQAGNAKDPGQIFSPQQEHVISMLQRLMLALTRLQLVAQKELIEAVVQPGSTVASPSAICNAPILWMAQELAVPLASQLYEMFGPSNEGSPGALSMPELMLGTVHRIALDNLRRIDFLQGVIQALELHGSYQIGVEFTRALREAVKQIQRQYKLPEIAGAGKRDVWLAWIDALIVFEGSLGRSGLLGCYWDVGDASDLPVLLLKGSTLSVLGENPAWMEAWLEAESATAAAQVESILYSEQGWGPGQQLIVEEGRPAWQLDVWPPRAAEDVVALVESLLHRMRYIPQPDAQEGYLAGAVGVVLEQTHGRIKRMLQQADVFRDITSYSWLPRVCMCICFCHYVEQQLQELHDNAQVMVTRLLEGQQQQDGNAHQEQRHQQQQHDLPNGNHAHPHHMHPQPHQQHNGGHAPDTSDGDQQQQWQRQENEQLSQAAAAKLRVLVSPISDFSTLRKEWVLKLGKAAAMGFMRLAVGYVSGRTWFKVTSESLPAMAAEGSLYSSGIVSGDLQPALAWLAALLHEMSNHLDKDCFRQAWGAAAAANH